MVKRKRTGRISRTQVSVNNQKLRLTWKSRILKDKTKNHKDHYEWHIYRAVYNKAKYGNDFIAFVNYTKISKNNDKPWNYELTYNWSVEYKSKTVKKGQTNSLREAKMLATLNLLKVLNEKHI
jgi:dsRNA-specific ribonuclease